MEALNFFVVTNFSLFVFYSFFMARTKVDLYAQVFHINWNLIVTEGLKSLTIFSLLFFAVMIFPIFIHLTAKVLRGAGELRDSCCIFFYSAGAGSVIYLALIVACYIVFEWLSLCGVEKVPGIPGACFSIAAWVAMLYSLYIGARGIMLIYETDELFS